MQCKRLAVGAYWWAGYNPLSVWAVMQEWVSVGHIWAAHPASPYIQHSSIRRHSLP